jgi:hypothetical protein
MSIIRDHEGKSSSKRVMGILYLVALLILFAIKEFKSQEIVNTEIFVVGMITGAALLGLEIAKYFAKMLPETKK